MTTLKRELRTKFEEVLQPYADKLTIAERESLADLLVDAAKELRAFQTDEERPAYGLDWKLGHGQEVTQRDLDTARLRDKAPKMFEKAFGVHDWPWSSTPTWTKFEKFVTAIYTADPLAFGNYIVWRKDKDGGLYTGYSNKKIREHPQMFMDTGWPEFELSKATKPPPQSSAERNDEVVRRVAERMMANAKR